MNIVKRKILIVEDDEINQMMIAENLDAMGMSYETAENGKIALEKIENNDYDVVLLDLKMPVMDGIEVLKRIKSNNRINKSL